jgi:hypothetical protein
MSETFDVSDYGSECSWHSSYDESAIWHCHDLIAHDHGGGFCGHSFG